MLDVPEHVVNEGVRLMREATPAIRPRKQNDYFWVSKPVYFSLIVGLFQGCWMVDNLMLPA